MDNAQVLSKILVRARVVVTIAGDPRPSTPRAPRKELHPAAWSTMINLVASAARFELRRTGLEFDPKGAGFGAPAQSAVATPRETSE